MRKNHPTGRGFLLLAFVLVLAGATIFFAVPWVWSRMIGALLVTSGIAVSQSVHMPETVRKCRNSEQAHSYREGTFCRPKWMRDVIAGLIVRRLPITVTLLGAIVGLLFVLPFLVWLVQGAPGVDAWAGFFTLALVLVGALGVGWFSYGGRLVDLATGRPYRANPWLYGMATELAPKSMNARRLHSDGTQGSDLDG